MSTVAFIGLGMMGRPMAERLIDQGHDVRVNDADPALADVFGGAWRASPRAAAEGVDVLVTMLPNGQIVREVLLGAGEGALALAPGAVVIDCSSADAAGTVALGAELAERGIALVDAPVSGGTAMAREGKLTLMVGGADEALFARITPVLDALGARTFRVGPLGAGHAVKAINNAIAACNFAVMSQGLALGTAFGLDPAVLLEVINSSTGRSGVSEGLFPSQVLTQRYGLGFSLALMTKDVGLAQSLGQGLGLDLPMIELTGTLYREALDHLGAKADFTAYHAFTQHALGGDNGR